MIEQYREVLSAALALPEPARSELADQLITSLTPVHEDHELAATIHNRLQEVERDEAQTVSAEEAISGIRRRLAEKRQP